mmetsp:Transcript_81244/g.227757  ORF Transcript_81244/g.227757 Transcript_81244/m.227757 type:complete len:134 (+) Transcript_81244:2-403(+)
MAIMIIGHRLPPILLECMKSSSNNSKTLVDLVYCVWNPIPNRNSFCKSYVKNWHCCYWARTTAMVPVTVTVTTKPQKGLDIIPRRLPFTVGIILGNPCFNRMNIDPSFRLPPLKVCIPPCKSHDVSRDYGESH